MYYLIRVADITILADVPFVLNQSDKMKSFFWEENDSSSLSDIDFRIKLCPVSVLPGIADVRYRDMRRFYTGEGSHAGTFFCSAPERAPYAFVSRETASKGFLCCNYLPGNEKYMDYAHNLTTLMDIEATLLDFDALIMHASLISWQGRGIVFSAPSKTGKSTQAALWEQYAGAEILNGDRTALRKTEDVWKGYGMPYAGTSGIYRNESVPLKGVVALRQSKENRIRRIHGAEAFRFLYPETMIHRWDAFFEEKATKLLLSVISEIPVFLLECRPDKSAVELLKSEIETIYKQE